MFTPILVTTPRSGSSLVCQVLGDICIQAYNYKNDLQEYFTIEPGYESTYTLKNNVITSLQYREVPEVPLWFDSDANISSMTRAKAEMLLSNPYKYMIKIFVGQMQTDKQSSDYIKRSLFDIYTPVYLERQDILAQFFSWVYAGQTKHFHWQKDQVAKDIVFPFSLQIFDRFKLKLAEYKEEKKARPGKIIVYEDFLNKGGDCQALIEILDLKIDPKQIVPTVVKTIPTPYNFDYRKLMDNNPVWVKHKNKIEDYCLNYTHNTN